MDNNTNYKFAQISTFGLLVLFLILLGAGTQWYSFIVVGVIGVPVFLLSAIVCAVLKRDAKTMIIMLCISAVSLAAGTVLVPYLTPQEWKEKECKESGHIYSISIVNEASCITEGKAIETCMRCGGTNETTVPLSDHDYDDTIITDSSCTELGELYRVCSVCKANETIVIDYIQHSLIEVAYTPENCVDNGEKTYRCDVCEKEFHEVIPAYGHSWMFATCTEPQTCEECYAEEGQALGHTTEAGYCRRCEEIVHKKSPVTIKNMTYSMDSDGGVSWSFKIKNNSDKTIKYMSHKWTCYNAVDDVIKDKYSGNSYNSGLFTGPLEPGKTSKSMRTTDLFYNYSYSYIKLDELVVEYMDGTKETVNGYYTDIFEK